MGEGGVNGRVCTERVVRPPLAPGPSGRREPHADPLPRTSPGGKESPEGLEEGDFNPVKEPAGEGGFAPALLLFSVPLTTLAKPIRAP